MLAKRVIPTVLVRGRTACKGPGFGPACTRSIGSAVAVCRTHAKRGVDELLVLDIGATPSGAGPDLALVAELCADCFIPITVGGGVRTLADIDALLRAGADKVAIGESHRRRPRFLWQAIDHFGAQAIVAVVEHRSDQSGAARRFPLPRHAGEIVLQCVDRDGRMAGYDLAAVRQVSAIVDCPVVVSGGCSGPDDMLAAIRAGADGVAAGALFAFTDHTPRSCTAYLQAHAIEVRT